MARRGGGTRAIGVNTDAPPLDALAVAAGIRDARTARSPLRIVGGGTWLDAGRPVHADGSLSLSSLRGVTQYEPGDFTLAVRAGTPLGEIDDIVGREGQWLTLQPHGSNDGTIGATIATASWGPLASAYGTPRDHLLGCEVVTGAGEIVRAGGRVVKNVAGFDLARLMTGAWGTLGVITEVTVRLRARPEVDHSLAIALEGTDERACADAASWLRTTPYRPLAAELCSAAMSDRLGLERRALLLVRFGGNETLVRAVERDVAELGTTMTVDSAVWDRLRTSEPAGAGVVRLGALPTELSALWARVTHVVAGSGGVSHATIARGVMRCILPAARTSEEIEALRGIMKELHAPGSRIAERLPRQLWPDVPSAVGDALSSDVQRTFDPDSLLNPGILGPTA
jgi:glycolate oxidase FAD binding subunit